MSWFRDLLFTDSMNYGFGINISVLHFATIGLPAICSYVNSTQYS